MRNIFSLLLCVFAISLVKAQEGLPSNPKPGTCYVRCITQDEYRTVEERIMTRPEYSRLEVVPATFKTIEERVLVKEASKRFIYVPAVYETVDVSYISKENSSTLSIVPATFTDANEERIVYPASTGWEYSSIANCTSNNPGDCQVLCFVEKPSRSRTIAVKNLASDASFITNPVGEVTAVYKKQVVKTPARMEEVEIPAEYTTIRRQVVDIPASTRTVKVPAEYTTITKTELVKAGGITSYTEIDCKLTSYNALPIFYDLGSAALTADSRRVIDENLLKLLRDKPNVSVEVASHTDSRADDAFNMSLSQRRAESVVNYLVSKGINRNRLVAKGFGETKLVNRCANGIECTEEEHSKNRRTEFRVISQ